MIRFEATNRHRILDYFCIFQSNILSYDWLQGHLTHFKKKKKGSKVKKKRKLERNGDKKCKKREEKKRETNLVQTQGRLKRKHNFEKDKQ
jgi:hypothetical protein